MNCACRVLFISRQWLCVQAGASAWPCCTNVFLEGFVSLDLDERSCIFESTPLSPHWKGSEMDLWVSNQSLGHLSPRCKTTVCKLSQLNKLLGEREAGNWRRPGASLLSQLRGHCGSREETVWLPYVPSTADGEVISATLFLKKKNRNQKWDVKKKQAPFCSAAGLGRNRRAGPLSEDFWGNSWADVKGFSSLWGSPLRIYCWAINRFLNYWRVM